MCILGSGAGLQQVMQAVLDGLFERSADLALVGKVGEDQFSRDGEAGIRSLVALCVCGRTTRLDLAKDLVVVLKVERSPGGLCAGGGEDDEVERRALGDGPARERLLDLLNGLLELRLEG